MYISWNIAEKTSVCKNDNIECKHHIIVPEHERENVGWCVKMSKHLRYKKNWKLCEQKKVIGYNNVTKNKKGLTGRKKANDNESNSRPLFQFLWSVKCIPPLYSYVTSTSAPQPLWRVMTRQQCYLWLIGITFILKLFDDIVSGCVMHIRIFFFLNQ